MESKPGPQARKYVFGFLDETGLLNTPATDRVFGLGLMISHHPEELHRKIINYKNSIRFHEEFKFTGVDSNNIGIYKGLLDILFSCKEIRFHSVFYDKNKLDIQKVYKGDSDRAYNAFTARLVADSIHISEYIAILADDVSTKISNNFEKQIKERVKDKTRRNALFGIARLESHAVAEIQLVDVILGTVAYSFKVKYGLVKPKKGNPKLKLVKHLQKQLNRPLISESFVQKMRFGLVVAVKEF
jgi:hypothetical protein